MNSLTCHSPTRTTMEHSGSVPVPSFTASPPLYSLPSSSVLSSLYGKPPSWFYTTAAIIISLLFLEQFVYRYKKRHLPGDSWTIPLIGKFADSMSPSMEGYKKQWDSGALSAISVFNMYAFLYYSHLPDPSFCQLHCHGFIKWIFSQDPQFSNVRRTLSCTFSQANSSSRQLVNNNKKHFSLELTTFLFW